MLSRPVIVFTALLCAGAMLSYFAPVSVVSPFVFWAVLVPVACLFALAARRGPGGTHSMGRSAFLCDSCKYNDARCCSRPERPNASRCPDYKSRVG